MIIEKPVRGIICDINLVGCFLINYENKTKYLFKKLFKITYKNIYPLINMHIFIYNSGKKLFFTFSFHMW